MSTSLRGCACAAGLLLCMTAGVRGEEVPAQDSLDPDRAVQFWLGLAPAFGSSSGGSFGRLDPAGGLHIRLSPHFALRPSLSGGRSSQGTFLSAGVLGLYHPWPGRRLSPYFGVGATYVRDAGPDCVVGAFCQNLPAAPASSGPNYLTLSGHVGLHLRFTRRLGAFVETGLGHTLGRRYEWNGQDWRSPGFLASKSPVRSDLGLSIGF
jgi:hypothetical protein